MKKLFIFLALWCVLACERSTLITVQAPDSATEAISSSASLEEQIGKMAYTHMKLHMDNLDPLAYFSPQQATLMRKALDSLETSGVQSADVFLASLSRSARINASAALNLRTYLGDVSKHFSAISTTSWDEENKWFTAKQDQIRSRTDLDQATKTNLLVIGAVMKYSTKAILESMPRVDSQPGARIAIDGGCLQELSECASANVVNYIGFAAGLGSAAGPMGTLYGAVAGAVIGLARSVHSCSCNQSTPCGYPRAVTTPYVCYNSGSGLDIRVLGYGDNPSGFELEIWDNPQRSGLPLASPIQAVANGNVFHVSDSDIQGKRLIYVRPVTNCNGDLKYAPDMLEININKLGTPDFVVTGPQNPTRGSQVTVYAVGPYTDGYNLQWYTPPYYGQIISTNGAYNSALVQINPGGGYGYVSASLTTACATLTERYEYSAQ
ncbi:hypothetical protein [Spirosoma terrae]|uniref:Lipoprotein n=1 Tax=Spirosoma terrae TaxID=1968276 RepID=A0A6L9L477_9BACT|nr:hypothetical protein [Spirosoma terrae]NDU95260.1 hypothetical protein [Spirosoma terrae]